MTDTLNIPGNILFLSCDPAKLDAQLDGGHLSLREALPLRDDVSTDEMTPQTTGTVYDERLGDLVLIAFYAGGRKPISAGTIKKGRFSVIVAGKRYGKGSSREHSPLAHLSAGIRLIVAESFERIFRQNCDNLGIFTSTDFGLIKRINAGGVLNVSEFLAGRDALTQEILRAGGLLNYAKTRLFTPHRRNGCRRTSRDRPMTLVEKIISRNLLDPSQSSQTGNGCFVRVDWRFCHEYYTAMIAHSLHKNFGRPAPLHDGSTILLFEDHLTFAHRSEVHLANNLLEGVRDLSSEHRKFASDYGLTDHGSLRNGEGSEGICHAMMTEQYALPGQVVVGTDSHTTHIGALGCLAFGIGSTDMASAMVTGFVRITVPTSLRVELTGQIPAGVTAKDIVLHLLAQPGLKAGDGLGHVFEFTGSAITEMSLDDRATLTNMTAELGGFTGIVAPDRETVRFLKDVRNVDYEIEEWMFSDPGATYAKVIRLDCSNLTPMVSAPGDPGNGEALGEIKDRVKLDIAYGGSCTGGKREDFDQYHAVLAWAAEHGLRVAPHVSLFLQYGTMQIKNYCMSRGYLETFDKVGAEMLMPACGACAGGGPGASKHPDQVTVSAINRNFPGRSGPGKVWLASPSTVAASAIAGELLAFHELQERYANGQIRPS